MPPYSAKKIIHTFSLVITVAAVITSSTLWLRGFLTETNYSRAVTTTDSSAYMVEKSLAEAYWRRYPDIGQSTYWGPGGPLGIYGPRDHYEQYGKDEGRVFFMVSP